VHPSLIFIIITKELGPFDSKDNIDVINAKLGKLSDVFHERFFTPISQKMFQLLRKGSKVLLEDDDEVFVNWKVYSQKKSKEGRLPLFIASEQSVKWSDGLCYILDSYGAAIKDADEVTGLEAFMLAGIGEKSDMETIYKLLQDYPAAMNPYVAMPQE